MIFLAIRSITVTATEFQACLYNDALLKSLGTIKSSGKLCPAYRITKSSLRTLQGSFKKIGGIILAWIVVP